MVGKQESWKVWGSLLLESVMGSTGPVPGDLLTGALAGTADPEGRSMADLMYRVSLLFFGGMVLARHEDADKH